jgi:protease I
VKMTKKALFITANFGVEKDELVKPLEFLKSKGIETHHAAEEKKSVQTVVGDKDLSDQIEPDLSFDEINASDYDILIIPGGTVNADNLRIHPQVQKLIQNFTDHQKPIAAICHAPWTLIDAQRIQDKNLTSYKSVKLDLENAGGKWVDEEVHRCNTGGGPLITSRCPDDIPAFNEAIYKELTQV